MTKLTTAAFLFRARHLTADECIAWVERMRDALAASDEPTVAERAADFDEHIKLLRYRCTLADQTLNQFRRIVAHQLADGYGTLYSRIFPGDPHHAADISA